MQTEEGWGPIQSVSTGRFGDLDVPAALLSAWTHCDNGCAPEHRLKALTVQSCHVSVCFGLSPGMDPRAASSEPEAALPDSTSAQNELKTTLAG